MLVISPYAKSNFVDNTLTDQSSIIPFIEYNWSLPGIGQAIRSMRWRDRC